MIIDKTGKIVFKGHPAGRKDLAKDFSDLLEDKTLEGLEAGAGAADGASEEEAGPVATLGDIKAAMTEMGKFSEIGKEL